jgi:plasmid stability protein
MADRKPYPSEQQERFIIRFPDGMRDKISALAKANGRSMNAEVISMIEASLRQTSAALPAANQIGADALVMLAIHEAVKGLQADVAELRDFLLVPDFTKEPGSKG